VVMVVSVQQAPLRTSQSYFTGKTLAVLPYGTRVTVLETQKDWDRVSYPEKKLEGWLHVSALRSAEVALRSGSKAVAKGASSGEAATATKGIGELKEVEGQYRQDNNLDYSWVDTMETFTVPIDRIIAFYTQGGLTPEGGTQ